MHRAVSKIFLFTVQCCRHIDLFRTAWGRRISSARVSTPRVYRRRYAADEKTYENRLANGGVHHDESERRLQQRRVLCAAITDVHTKIVLFTSFRLMRHHITRYNGSTNESYSFMKYASRRVEKKYYAFNHSEN